MKTNWDLLKVASDLINRREYNEAEQILLQELETTPGSIALLNKLADLYIRTRRFSEAEKTVQNSLSIDPENFYSLQKKGDYLAAVMKYREAEEIFKSLILRHPDDIYLLKRLSRITFLKGSSTEALEYAERALKLEPERGDINYQIFQIHMKNENYPMAAAAIDKAIEYSPRNDFYLKEKMSMRVRQKNLNSDDIRDSMDSATVDKPRMLKVLAERLKEEKKHGESAEAYERLLEIEESDFNRKLYAFALYRAGEYDKAFKNFIMLDDNNFLEIPFVNSIMKSAQNTEEKQELLGRMVILAKKTEFRRLWGHIKKLQNILKETDDEKDS